MLLKEKRQKAMTLDEAAELINAAKKGDALDVANEVIPKLSDFDQEMAGPDLEAMAVLLDNSLEE